jgi:para-nitrobenzyl esterase
MTRLNESRALRPTKVATTAGTVEGFARDGVTRWRSIPYAAPPWQGLRFRAPQSPTPWRGVRDCQEFSFCAPQDPRFTFTGVAARQSISEDCLSLNVVAPSKPIHPALPVMFFVHGGGYVFGSSATPIYDGAPLARQGCVYVSANYRLGPLGCLDLSSLATPEYPIDSNLFLRDLVFALQWVKDNIAGFGGDPDNVTIFGESAGGHAVSALLAVPQAHGLFHRAISESPPAGMVRPPEVAEEIADRFVHELGAKRRDAARAVMQADSARLIETLSAVTISTLRRVPGAFGIGATVDGQTLLRDPVESMALGEAHRVPLIVGHNAHEATLFARFMNYLPTSHATIEQLLATIDTSTKARLLAAYPHYPHPRACLRIGSDIVFGSHAWRIAEAHARHAPTYLYRYDYAPRPLSWSGFGATHGTELLAVFDVYRSRLGRLLTLAGDWSAALHVSDDIQRRWISFGHSGVPGGAWPRYSEPERPVMIFDRRSRIEYDPAPARRRAWANLSPIR